MPSKKIVCLGGGGGYFGGVIHDLIINEELKGSEIAVYDINMERAQKNADYGQTISNVAGANFKVHAVKDLAKAVDGADFGIASIGGIGGDKQGFHDPAGVHTKDIVTCARYGIFQIIGDTSGPAAMMAAFRTIPIYYEMCLEMQKRSPRAVFINHANPMAMLCRAMCKYTNIKTVIGLCHGVQGGKEFLSQLLNIPMGELDVVWIGTNHYYWFTEIYHKGKDISGEVKKRMARHQTEANEVMYKKLCSIYGYQITYPSDNHIIEFYPFLAQLKDGSQLPYRFKEAGHGPETIDLYAKHGLAGKVKPRKPVRAGPRPKPRSRQEWLDAVIKNFTKELNEIKSRSNQAVDIEKEMAKGEKIGYLVGAIATGRRHVHVVNIPNKGAIPNLPHEAVLEIEGVTDSHGIRGVYMGEAPIALKGLLESTIAYQEVVVDAAIKGSKQLALQALMLDKMAILPDKAEAMLNALLVNSKNFLPQFKK